MLFDAPCVVCADSLGPLCAPCVSRFTAAAPLDIPGVDSCRAAFVLDTEVRTAIAALKYRRQRRVAQVLAAHAVALVPQSADVITWLPATPERKRARGFDQAQALAQCLSRATGVPLSRLMRRRHGDTRQTGKTRAERQTGPSLLPVHRCPPFVVIVDDVITTGSSMGSASQVLRQSGAHRVIGVAVAATPPK